MALPQTSSSAGNPEARQRLCATGPCQEGRRVSTAQGRGPGSSGANGAVTPGEIGRVLTTCGQLLS